jgi:hypothetical protein
MDKPRALTIEQLKRWERLSVYNPKMESDALRLLPSEVRSMTVEILLARAEHEGHRATLPSDPRCECDYCNAHNIYEKFLKEE